MKKKDNKKRTYRIEFYVNEKEYNKILKQQKLSGLTKSALMRDLVLGLDIRPAPPEKYFEIYRLTANIANNTNQVAKIANATGQIDSMRINGLLTMVNKCWQLLKELR